MKDYDLIARFVK